MRRPRGLSPEEAELWRKLASTVTPLVPAPPASSRARPATASSVDATPHPQASGPGVRRDDGLRRGRTPPVSPPPPPKAEEKRPLDKHGLDSGWERRLARGLLDPDFTLDLHGTSLDGAHARLAMGLSQAKAMGARVVLLITGRPRPVEAADRGQARGAIRAKVVDWIAVGEHAHDIAAIRGAHRRHGGAGALYIVLKRRR